jgi:hypothetical protein
MQQHYDTAVSKFQAMSGKIALTKNKSETKSHILEVQKAFDALIEHVQDKRRYSSVRKQANCIRELLAGSIRGISSGELSRLELISALVSGEKFFAKFENEYSATLTADVRRTARELLEAQEELTDDQSTYEAGDINMTILEQSMTPEWQKTLSTAQAVIEKHVAHSAPNEDPKVAQLSAKFEEWEKLGATSPSNMKGQAWSLISLPIVPLYKDFTLTTSENLKQLGIKHTIFEGYAVLENQKIMYFDIKKVAKEFQMKPIDYAEDIVQLINMRVKDKFVVASDIVKVSKKNAGIAMVWLLPERVLSAMLKRQNTGRSVRLKDWDFPFNRENM